jgi:hypothetical protein
MWIYLVYPPRQVSAAEAERLRRAGVDALLTRRKLALILDLDHTLLNSERIATVTPERQAALERWQVSGRGGRAFKNVTSWAAHMREVQKHVSKVVLYGHVHSYWQAREEAAAAADGSGGASSSQPAHRTLHCLKDANLWTKLRPGGACLHASILILPP